MKNRCAVMLWCFLPATLFANVTGVVRNDANKPVARVFVRFVNAADSTAEASTYTDSLGRYSLSLPAGVGVIHSRGINNVASVSLEQNRPNPVSTATSITFHVPRSGLVELAIFSLRGQLVDRISQQAAAGSNAIIWRPASSLPEGAYVYRLKYNGLMAEKTMIVSGSHGGGSGGLRSNAGNNAVQTSSAGFTAAAATGYNIFIYGRGVFPYKAGAVALTDGTTKDFSLKYIDLWDSSRVILRDSMVNCRYQFQKNKAGRVVFLGGSITNNPGWRDSVTSYLKVKFPQTVFTFVNAGIPSVGSNMHAFRIKRDIFSSGKIDLLFVDASANDTINNISNNINWTARRRAMEGIIRQARAHNPNIDIVSLYMADDVFYPSIQTHDSIPFLDSYEQPAWYYGVSCVNFAQYVAERYTWAQFGGDVHPALFGTQIYARILRHFFDVVWKDSLPAASQVAKYYSPVRRIDTLCYEYGYYDSITTAQLVNGWNYVASWKPTVCPTCTRDGFVNVPALEAPASGAKLTFSFTGTAVGIVSPEGPDVGYIIYQIDNGKSSTLDQFTPWSSGLHIPWIWMFGTDLANTHHTLTLITSTTKNSASTGYASRIFEFAVNGQE